MFPYLSSSISTRIWWCRRTFFFFFSFLPSLSFSFFPRSSSPNPPCAVVSSCRSSILLRISGGKITRDASDKVDVTAKTVAARGFVSRLIIELRIVAVKAIYRDTRRVSFTDGSWFWSTSVTSTQGRDNYSPKSERISFSISLLVANFSSIEIIIIFYKRKYFSI